VTGHNYNTISVITYNIALKLFLDKYMGTVRKVVTTDINFTKCVQNQHIYGGEREVLARTELSTEEADT
jgi:hypothetical protein